MKSSATASSCINRRYMYAGLHWAMENHSSLLEILRELMGGGTFQFPASIEVMRDPKLKRCSRPTGRPTGTWRSTG